MVVDRRIIRDLDGLGVDMDSSHMRVWCAILMAAGDADVPVVYTDIAKNLEALTGKRYTRAYIYRQLTALKESNFIQVDTISTPRTYSVSESRLVRTLEALREEKLSYLQERKHDLTTKLKRLRAVKSNELALLLHNQLAGVSSIDNSLMIEGIENVRSTIIREFADGAKRGDMVRVLGHASTLAEGLGPGGVTELRLLQTGFRGVRVYGIMTTTGGDRGGLDLIASHLKPMVNVLEEAQKTGNIQVRLTREPTKTYRMVSLNEDKMLLYLTHSKESDMAALIHRRDNPGLVEDALRTFDELWEKSIDILDMAKQMAKQDYGS
ncbi:MAG: hypothetical protein ACFFCP_09645 [Promethearchaeota archaeon]